MALPLRKASLMRHYPSLLMNTRQNSFQKVGEKGYYIIAPKKCTYLPLYAPFTPQKVTTVSTQIYLKLIMYTLRKTNFSDFSRYIVKTWISSQTSSFASMFAIFSYFCNNLFGWTIKQDKRKKIFQKDFSLQWIPLKPTN